MNPQRVGRMWGHVGTISAAVNPKGGSDFGLYRDTLIDGVRYSASTSLPAWKMLSEQEFFLSLSKAKADSAISLRQFAFLLKPPFESRILERLDAVASELCEIVGQLHLEKRGLGMATPDNVVVVEDHKVLLIDHGFYFDGSHTHTPQWMHERTPPPGADLWDLPIDRQQISALPEREFDPAADVRLMVRFFQGLLLNDWKKGIESGKSVRQKTSSTKLWASLAKLEKATDIGVKDPIKSLREALQNTPLSSHFQKTPSNDIGQRPRHPLAKTIWMLSLFTAACVGSALYTGHLQVPWALPVPPNTPPPTTGSAVSAILSKIPTDGTDISEQLGVLEEAVQVDPSKDPKTAEMESELINTRLKRSLELWGEQFQQSVVEFEPSSTRKAASQKLLVLRHLIDRAQKISAKSPDNLTSERVNKCMRAMKLLESDERFRGWLSSSP